MDVFVKPNAPVPIRKARPAVGKVFKTLKEVLGDYKKLAVNEPVLAVGVTGTYTTVQKNDGTRFNVNNEFLVSVPKSEADEVRRELASRVTASPVGKGSGFNAGTDPEVFCVVDGKVMPAWNYLPGKKEPLVEWCLPSYDNEEARRVYAAQKDKLSRKVFWDGFQAEFTVPAASCHEVLVQYIRAGLASIQAHARKVDPKASVTHHCVLDTSEEYLATCHPSQVELGCDPSKNAYTEAPNPRLQEVDPSHLPFRFAGFHVHSGCGSQTKAMYKSMVRMMDAIAGVISVPLLWGLEDARRRQYYGLAGEYRTPPHGLEWRTLSSAALVHPAVTHLLLDVARQAARLAVSGYEFLWEASKQEVQECINTLNLELAQAILKRNEKMLGVLLQGIYGSNPAVPGRAKVLIDKGAKQVLSMDMQANWCLSSDRFNNNWTVRSVQI